MEDDPAPGWRYEWGHLPDTTHESEATNDLFLELKGNYFINLLWWVESVGVHVVLKFYQENQARELTDIAGQGRI